MSVPDAAMELEYRHVDGAATLAKAFELLRERWQAGDRDRELGLHLMFLAWYLVIEPPHITGLDEQTLSSKTLPAIFREVHAHFSRVIQTDAEMLYVVGLMARLCPWCIGDDAEWERRSAEYREAYRRLAPDGLPRSLFEGRGFYGHYFAGQSQVARGY